jgi:indolepyruvate ferredoxin oxidoreductase alpha subunit
MADQVVVVEEVEPLVETELKAQGIKVIGKEILPLQGELAPPVIKPAIARLLGEPVDEVPLRIKPAQVFPGRRPCAWPARTSASITPCRRCATHHLRRHRLLHPGRRPPVEGDGHLRLDGRLDGHGAGHGQGARRGRQGQAIVAVIGDSTFLHMGMQGLLDMVYNKGNVTVLLLDNRAVGMTGGQDNPGNGRDIYGDEAPRVDFAKLCEALGVKKERIHVVNPYELPVLFKTIREEVKVPDVSVIITDQPCVLIKDYHKLKPFEVIEDKCTGCGNCIDVGCPAIHVTRRAKEVKPNGREVDLAFVRIESSVCTGCTLCVQPCAPGAIVHYAPVSPIKLVTKGCGA